jgi:hypothetical protein
MGGSSSNTLILSCNLYIQKFTRGDGSTSDTPILLYNLYIQKFTRSRSKYTKNSHTVDGSVGAGGMFNNSWIGSVAVEFPVRNR